MINIEINGWDFMGRNYLKSLCWWNHFLAGICWDEKIPMNISWAFSLQY